MALKLLILISCEEIIEVLKAQPLIIRENVKEVSVDMWGGFPKVIDEVFPNARVVIDQDFVLGRQRAEGRRREVIILLALSLGCKPRPKATE